MHVLHKDFYRILLQDDAVTGEAAGLAMGLVELGSKSETAIEDMVSTKTTKANKTMISHIKNRSLALNCLNTTVKRPILFYYSFA